MHARICKEGVDEARTACGCSAGERLRQRQWISAGHAALGIMLMMVLVGQKLQLTGLLGSNRTRFQEVEK